MSDLPRGALRPTPLSRRELLLTGGAALSSVAVTVGLAGCEATSSERSATTTPRIDPLTSVLLGQQRLLATYDQSLAAFPELSPALADLQAQSVAHTAALLQAAPGAAAQVAAAASGSNPDESPPPPAADSTTSVADLARAVDTAAGSLRAAALRASGELAALLGSCAASTACHARLLGL